MSEEPMRPKECGITGASFIGCTINGKPMDAGQAPIVGKNGNIAWPAGWSEEQRREWRMMANEPGAEWPGSEPAARTENPFR